MNGAREMTWTTPGKSDGTLFLDYPEEEFLTLFERRNFKLIFGCLGLKVASLKNAGKVSKTSGFSAPNHCCWCHEMGFKAFLTASTSSFRSHLYSSYNLLWWSGLPVQLLKPQNWQLNVKNKHIYADSALSAPRQALYPDRTLNVAKNTGSKSLRRRGSKSPRCQWSTQPAVNKPFCIWHI